jgi:hypothetical protein
MGKISAAVYTEVVFVLGMHAGCMESGGSNASRPWGPATAKRLTYAAIPPGQKSPYELSSTPKTAVKQAPNPENGRP